MSSLSARQKSYPFNTVTRRRPTQRSLSSPSQTLLRLLHRFNHSSSLFLPASDQWCAVDGKMSGVPFRTGSTKQRPCGTAQVPAIVARPPFAASQRCFKMRQVAGFYCPGRIWQYLVDLPPLLLVRLGELSSTKQISGVYDWTRDPCTSGLLRCTPLLEVFLPWHSWGMNGDFMPAKSSKAG